MVPWLPPTSARATGVRNAPSVSVLPFLVAAGLAALGDRITTATSVLVLVLVVVGVGAAGDRVASVLAAVSSGLWFDFFLTEPTGQFAINDPDDVEVVVLLVAVGVAVTEIALWGLRQQARAARRAGFLDGVLESADLAAGGDVAPDQAHARVADRIAEVLEVDRCRFEQGPVPPTAAAAALHRDGSVHRDGVAVDVAREGMPTDVETYLAAPAGDGHFRITASTRVAPPDPGAATSGGAPGRPAGPVRFRVRRGATSDADPRGVRPTALTAVG